MNLVRRDLSTAFETGLSHTASSPTFNLGEKARVHISETFIGPWLLQCGRYHSILYFSINENRIA